MRAVVRKGQAFGRVPRPLAAALEPTCANAPIAGEARAASPEPSGFKEKIMFRFQVQGRIGAINEYKNNTLRISVASDRLVEGNDGQWTKTEWLGCVSFNAELNAQMLTQLEKGQSVSLEGRIVPRTRERGDQKIYDHSFEITRFQLQSKPKAARKTEHAGASAPAA